MQSNDLTQVLAGAKSTVESSVLVGGTLLWHNDNILSNCVSKGISIRCLFPRLTSKWLKDYINFGGINYHEYIWRIRTNSDRARNLGSEVRFHDSPVAVWFALVDRQVLVTKPVAMFSNPPLSISSTSTDLRHFSGLFDLLWSRASNLSHSEPEDLEAHENYSKPFLPKPNIFLCHASDDKPAVRDLYGRLSESGIKPWLDEVDILPGQDWDLEITHAVKRADAVVVLLSCKSTTKRGYLNKEIRTALDTAAQQPEGTIFLIPVRLEECDVPDSLSKWQYVDIFKPQGFERLLQSLKSILSTGKRNVTRA